MTIYADELFAVNFISNILLLSVYAILFGLRRRYARLAAAAAAGGLYACLETVFGLPALLRTAVLMLMVYIALGGSKLILHTLRIMLLSVIAEGITMMAAALTGGSAELAAGRITVFAPELPLFIFYIISYPAVYAAKKIMLGGGRIKRVYIKYNCGETRFNVLYDSGNLLKYRGRPVLIVEWQAVRDILQIESYEQYKGSASDFVLYRTIGKTGAVPVFEPDICTIDGENRAVYTAVVDHGFSRKYRGIIGNIS